MIRLLLIIPLTFFFGLALSQQDPLFSQYMFNNMSINPGYAGSKDAICLTAYNRMQWVGFPGAPNTSLFTATAPIKPFNINSGIGITAINDVIGFQSTPSFELSYSYISLIKNGEGKLGIGVSVGILNSNFDSHSGNNTGYYFGFGNPAEPNLPGYSKESALTYDVGAGLYYHTDNLYLGVSSTHLTQSSYHFVQSSSTFTLTRNYYITSGYNFALQDPAFEVQPSAIIRYAGASSSIDLSTLMVYNKKIWFGLSYRINSAIVGIIGLELSNGIRFGYSYDFSLNNLSASTHEIMLSYNFSLVKEKVLHKYRSVRFL